ncbi:MAG: hypothetical protein M1538_00245 [Candidatus Marsarchaeota archaeon]|jgi:hypothetical protein|nr:hypothetical protein [Candidatus Marsarchaeota archaeon]
MVLFETLLSTTNIVRIILLLIITFAYMLFDIFNKRNVPTLFAYSTLIIGIIMTFVYLNTQIILLSFATAGIIALLGYVAYKAGQIGGADIIEFATISLIIFTLKFPLLVNNFQYGFPFIISVFIATGIVAIIFVPIYYIPKAYKKKIKIYATKQSFFNSLLISLSYLIFLAMLIYIYGLNFYITILFIIIITAAAVLIAFEKPIAETMIEYLSANELEEGDMIASSFINQKEIKVLEKNINFTKLVTNNMIKKMKEKKIKKKLPVYRTAIPLAVPIFFGVIISLLFGNILLLIL